MLSIYKASAEKNSLCLDMAAIFAYRNDAAMDKSCDITFRRRLIASLSETDEHHMTISKPIKITEKIYLYNIKVYRCVKGNDLLHEIKASYCTNIHASLNLHVTLYSLLSKYILGLFFFYPLQNKSTTALCCIYTTCIQFNHPYFYTVVQVNSKGGSRGGSRGSGPTLFLRTKNLFLRKR
jgi:hypothetical protein